ncbi:MAG: hypothetical protein RSC24_06205 [Clostridium sp.]
MEIMDGRFEHVYCTDCKHWDKLHKSLLDESNNIAPTPCCVCFPYNPEDSTTRIKRPRYEGESMVVKLLEKYKNEIMEYTLGDRKDEDYELYSDTYKYEWREFKDRLEQNIGFLKPAQLTLTPELLAYLIINEWGGVWDCEEYLNIEQLRRISKEIIQQL